MKKAMRALLLLCLGMVLAVPARTIAQTDNKDTKADAPAAKAVAVGNSEDAKLLLKWYAEGTAAGNVGDWYDNRDGGHSRLGLSRYPQLSAIEVTEEEKELAKRFKTRAHWGLLQDRIYPHVTFGNSSTSGAPPSGCSNPRYGILSTRATAVHYQQYTRNHLYVFPEHRDHDPGHNGHGGWGDLYHANIPYLIISQGSSGSDQVFLKAIASTLAAFRPEVKKRLVEKGVLMPTVQFIFRRSNKGIMTHDDYLTGAAHPSVFEGSKVDAVAMVRMAHEIQADSVPPMIQLTVIEEDEGVVGRDYFELGPREKVFDTPAAISRLGRSVKQVRRMVVSAQTSFDVNGRPLKYRWVVLRGDEKRIRINPLSPDASMVELLIPFHERMTVPGNPTMDTTRVDIGAFVHNGTWWSAPGFISYYFMDDELRTYAPDGRVLEVAYGGGDTRIGWNEYVVGKGYDITDWQAVLKVLTEAKGGFPSGLLRKQFKVPELKALDVVAAGFAAAGEGTAEQKKAIADAEDALKKAGEAVEAAKDKPEDELKKAQSEATKCKRELDKTKDAVAKSAGEVLKRARPELGGVSALARIEDALNAIKDDVNFCFAHAPALDALAEAASDAKKKKACVDARAELVGQFAAKVKQGDLTKWERNRVERLNIDVLQAVVFPEFLNWRYQRNFVDWRLASLRDWRDVYYYDDAKHLTGWTRYRDSAASDFTPEGYLVLKKDALGRALEARAVTYTADGGRRGPQTLEEKPIDVFFDITYKSDADRVGQAHKREKPAEPEEKKAEEKKPEEKKEDAGKKE